MDAQTLKTVGLTQLETLSLVATQSLGGEHSLTQALSQAAETVRAASVDSPAEETNTGETDADEATEEVGRVIPEGFADEEELQSFLDEQLGEGEDGEEAGAAVLDVIGTRYNEDGTTTELGNKEETFQRVREIIVEQNESLEEEGQEVPENPRQFSVEYKLLDGSTLTDETVNTIIAHPISNNLHSLGNLAILDIENGEDASTKTVNFVVLEEGELPLTAFERQIMEYRGSQVIPGIGLVQAVGGITAN